LAEGQAETAVETVTDYLRTNLQAPTAG